MFKKSMQMMRTPLRESLTPFKDLLKIRSTLTLTAAEISSTEARFEISDQTNLAASFERDLLNTHYQIMKRHLFRASYLAAEASYYEYALWCLDQLIQDYEVCFGNIYRFIPGFMQAFIKLILHLETSVSTGGTTAIRGADGQYLSSKNHDGSYYYPPNWVRILETLAPPWIWADTVVDTMSSQPLDPEDIKGLSLPNVRTPEEWEFIDSLTTEIVKHITLNYASLGRIKAPEIFFKTGEMPVEESRTANYFNILDRSYNSPKATKTSLEVIFSGYIQIKFDVLSKENPNREGVQEHLTGRGCIAEFDQGVLLEGTFYQAFAAASRAASIKSQDIQVNTRFRPGSNKAPTQPLPNEDLLRKRAESSIDIEMIKTSIINHKKLQPNTTARTNLLLDSSEEEEEESQTKMMVEKTKKKPKKEKTDEEKRRASEKRRLKREEKKEKESSHGTPSKREILMSNFKPEDIEAFLAKKDGKNA